MSISEVIKKRQKELKITTQELAELANLPYRTVNAIIKDESKDPRASTIKKICIALGITSDALLFDEKTSDDLDAMIREFETLDKEKREYAKKVLRAVLIQTKNEQLS